MSTANPGLLVPPPPRARRPDTPAGHAGAGRYARPVVSASPAPSWRYRLLGGLVVEGDDGRVPDLGGRKQRAVLATLDFALSAEGRSFDSPELRANLDRLVARSARDGED